MQPQKYSFPHLHSWLYGCFISKNLNEKNLQKIFVDENSFSWISTSGKFTAYEEKESRKVQIVKIILFISFKWILLRKKTFPFFRIIKVNLEENVNFFDFSYLIFFSCSAVCCVEIFLRMNIDFYDYC
jgi:hypothetical protein